MTSGEEPTQSTAQHWNSVYERVGVAGVSWYQAVPEMSLAIIDSLALPKEARIIDIGGGASNLATTLLDRRFTDITVLDVSSQALLSSQGQLGADAQRVQWLHEDLLEWSPSRNYGLWHDRAVFHFLMNPADQQRYVEQLRRALAPNGRVVIATFAPNGPQRCSGLSVSRYDAAKIATVFGDQFVLIDERREEHETPGGVVQPFTWAIFRPTASNRSA